LTAQLYALNEGWPFGDGPLRWFCHLEIRDGQAHIVCDQCPQSVFCAATAVPQRGFTWNLELLKSRIADHVLKCHAEAAAS
jgi:hypothetical protein